MRSPFLKRLFDFTGAFIALLLFGWIIIIFLAIAAADTRSSGLFLQKRVGLHGLLFTIFKLRTIRKNGDISIVGEFLRKTKIDELPQLFNVLFGHMSLVGPRPDIQGYYDKLAGNDIALLSLKPGITGLASLKYADEEKLLALQTDPIAYNDEVLFPDKIKINLQYLRKQSLQLDIKIILLTFAGRNMRQKFLDSLQY